MAEYLYNKSKVFLDSLTQEIGIAGLSGYTFATWKEPNKLHISFDHDLDQSEKSILDAVVSAHLGIETYYDAGMVAVADGSGNLIFSKDIPPSMASGIINNTIINNYYTNVVEGYNYSRYGNYYQYLTAEEEASTNDTNLRRRVDGNIHFPETCVYRISWYYEWKGSKDNYSIHSHICLDEDNPTIMDQSSTPAGADSWELAGGFWMGTVTSGTHNIHFAYAASHKNFAASVRRVRIEIMGVNHGE